MCVGRFLHAWCVVRASGSLGGLPQNTLARLLREAARDAPCCCRAAAAMSAARDRTVVRGDCGLLRRRRTRFNGCARRLYLLSRMAVARRVAGAWGCERRVPEWTEFASLAPMRAGLCAFSPLLSSFALSSGDGRVRLFDTGAGSRVWRLAAAASWTRKGGRLRLARPPSPPRRCSSQRFWAPWAPRRAAGRVSHSVCSSLTRPPRSQALVGCSNSWAPPPPRWPSPRTLRARLER